MVKIKWFIADEDVRNFSAKEFDARHHESLWGYFSLTVNQREIGAYPQELIDAGILNKEDNIFYWFVNLAQGIIETRKGNQHCFNILSEGFGVLVMERRGEKIEIDRIHTPLEEPSEILWEEVVGCKELEEEVLRSGRELLAWMNENTPGLMNSRSVAHLEYCLNEIEHPQNMPFIPGLLRMTRPYFEAVMKVNFLSTVDFEVLQPHLKTAIAEASEDNDTAWLGGLKLLIEQWEIVHKTHFDLDDIFREQLKNAELMKE